MSQLQTIIATLEDARYSHKNIYPLYLDFKMPFGSIDHAKFFAIMEALGYPIEAIPLIVDIYTTCIIPFHKTNPHSSKNHPR